MNSCGWQFLNLKITNSCNEFVWLTTGWSFSISRCTSYTEMVGPSVSPEKQVIPKWLVIQYFQKSRLHQNAWSFSISRFTSRKSSFETQNGLFRTDYNHKITNSCDEFVWLTVPEACEHRFLRWICVVDSSWTLKSQIPAKNSRGWQFLNLKITNSCDEFVWLTVPEPQNHKFLRWIRVVDKWLVLQYFQIAKLSRNGWPFSISRKAGYTKTVGDSVFPEKQVISEWLDFQYLQIHRSKNQVLRSKIDFLGLISSPKRLLNIF